VAVVVRDGVQPAELGVVHRVFGRPTGQDRLPVYDVRTCAPEPGAVRTGADFGITVPHDLGVLDDCDTVVVLAVHDGDRRVDREAAMLAGALATLRASTRVAAICTGAFVLAHAGLLDGRRATTHRASLDEFRMRFPRVAADPTVPFTDEAGVLTSSSEAAGIDMCRHLVRRDLGRVPDDAFPPSWAVPGPREPGSAGAPSSPIAVAQQWALDNLAAPLTLEGLAARTGLSVRTLTRRFRREVGVPPLEWVIRQRVARAVRMLEETEATVAQIAFSTGFGTATCMRQHFARQLNQSPSAYRANRALFNVVVGMGTH
jgi:transcriptional regulator GlxA family with amidase domain